MEQPVLLTTRLILRPLQRIYAYHFTRNLASGRILQKVGMIQEGCLRQHVQKWERFEDLICYGILRNEWESAHHP